MFPKAEMNLNANNQQYCLRWNDYGLNLRSSFSRLANDKAFVDVTLACERSSIQAHKVILAASSDYFKKLFLTNSCTHPIVILNDIKMKDLKALIDFIYTGQVNVLQSQLKRVLKLGHSLKIKGLMRDDKNAEELESDSFNSVNLSFERCSPSKVVENKVLFDDFLFKRRQRKKRLVFLSSLDTSDNSESEKRSASVSEEGQGKKAKRDEEEIEEEEEEEEEEKEEEEEEEKEEEVEVKVKVEEQESEAEERAKQEENKDEEEDGCNMNSSKKDNENQQVTLDISLSNSTKRHFGSPIILSKTESPKLCQQLGDDIQPKEPKEREISSQQKALGNKDENDQNFVAKLCICNICNLSFTAASSLRRHMMRHSTDPERFQCKICSKSYSRKDYLKGHIKIQHGAEA